ncbi:hypothetical protein VO01_14120 [Clavibacter michiganensis subsp. insidiosus]|uniref:HTH luxR-type domain-containing protein n=1 Tax=Clavibacter michiganensis subsp. insidiosus TaxID=33014 RepID=A0A0D5CKB9_9MICO|nr:hypothetical protein VO01_14120 [Clavibacter michiganensis subsp. insidiosus]AWF97238.1 hypothetical protein BEH61_01835 [Clavibacter michiganensis subsp. insidiosus]AWG02674.1 hypothetical protein BEH62_13835 [Clavibacter michiganensis subsp. insidiosus]
MAHSTLSPVFVGLRTGLHVLVAALLHITDAIVKSHLVHVFSKLGASSRTGAVAAARELGVLR